MFIDTYNRPTTRRSHMLAAGVAFLTFGAAALPATPVLAQTAADAATGVATSRDYQIGAQSLTSALVRFSTSGRHRLSFFVQRRVIGHRVKPDQCQCGRR
jgi:hypothetical protein